MNYSNILNELNKAVKMHNFYPDGHPNYESALSRCYLAIKKSVDKGGEIKWTVDQRGFYDNKKPVAPANPDIIGLAKKLFFRRIKEITFTARLSLEDMKAFMTVLDLEPDELQAKGGAEAVFAENDVAGLLINALRYEDLKKLKQELQEKKEAEEIAKAKEEEAAPGESAQSAEEEPKPEKEKEEELSFEALLERIREECDLLRYKDLSVRIKEKLDLLLIDRKFDEAFKAFLVFTGHASDVNLPEDIRQAATERLRSGFNRDMIQYLAGRVGAKEENFRSSIQSMLLHAGTEAVEVLLDAIIEAPEAITRRHLFNTLVLFGREIKPLVEARIKNPEWYVVRQMVSLLGDLGDPQAIDAIEWAYGNTDVRVKKEVMKTLVKLPSERSAAFLIKVLGEEDQGLVSQAIISLGMLKDPSAIDILGRIAVKWEPFADTQDAKREAIKALGIIGDKRGIPYLTSVLFKKAWFGKKANEEVRSLAAFSLGMIGGAEAFEAIEQVSRNSEGELYIACKRILEGREKTI